MNREALAKLRSLGNAEQVRANLYGFKPVEIKPYVPQPTPPADSGTGGWETVNTMRPRTSPPPPSYAPPPVPTPTPTPNVEQRVDRERVRMEAFIQQVESSTQEQRLADPDLGFLYDLLQLDQTLDQKVQTVRQLEGMAGSSLS